MIEPDLTGFAYGIGHDLKAPLTSIIGLLTFCQDDLRDGLTEELEENLTRALELCYRGADRVDGLLDYARIPSLDFPRELVNLEQMIQTIWDELDVDGKASIGFDISIGSGDQICTERTTLTFVLRALLDNAARYNLGDGSPHAVSVKAEAFDDSLRIEVTDTGVGIETARASDVFQIFRKIDARGGRGVELALSRKYLDRIGGSIRFKSSAGHGTCFVIDVPLLVLERE